MRNSRSIARTASILVLHACAVATLLQADDWTAWRGPGGDGRAPQLAERDAWPDALQEVWSIEVGEGHSSPLVVGERVFLHSRQGDEEVVRTIALGSGEVIWKKSDPVTFKAGMGAGRHGKGPKATPAWQRGRLFTRTIRGALTAWHVETGEKLWSTDLGERFPKTAPSYGSSSSPLVVGERVVAHFGSGKDGALVALEAVSGKPVWSLDGEAPAYASPVLVEISGSRQIVTQAASGILAVDPESGELLWSFPLKQTMMKHNMVTPLAEGDRIIVSGKDRGILALEPKQENSAWSVSLAWKIDDLSMDLSSPVGVDGLVYGLSHRDKGRIFCLEAKSGVVRWQSDPRAAEYATLMASRDLVAVMKESGELLLVGTGGEALRVARSYRVGQGSIWAHPAPLDDGILVKDRSRLTRWRF